MKVLIVVPRLKQPGGVANYYTVIKPYLKSCSEYYEIGSHPNEHGFIASIVRMIRDYVNFFKLLYTREYDLVHFNPSLGAKSVVRDGIFIIISKFLKVKSIVFFRGWDLDFEKKLEKYYLFLFRAVYFKVDTFIVLASDFKNKLISYGCKSPIYLETTIVDDVYLQSVDSRDLNTDINITFLSRIEKDKGIYEAIDAFIMLKSNYPQVVFKLAGTGSELENVLEYVKSKNVTDFIYEGYVTGQDKINLLKSTSIFFFPTAFGEGMPNAILEAMAFGIPVITRPVGGIADFFKNEKMGFITESMDPEVFSTLIEKLVIDNELRLSIGEFNRLYASENFVASKVSERLLSIYNDVAA